MPHAINGRKFCSTCKIEKDVKCFNSDKVNNDGLTYCCKECISKKGKIKYKSKKLYDAIKEGRKICTYCKKEKDVSEFFIDKHRKDGLTIICKKCNTKKTIEYYKKENEKVLKQRSEKRSKRTKKQKDKIKLINKMYRKNNKEKLKIKYKKYNQLPHVILKHKIRNSIRKSLKGTNKNSSSLKLLGCTIDFLKEHLQKTAIQNGYLSFDINNYSGKEYHIDHKIPINAFSDLSKEEQQKACFNWSNLQMLTIIENKEKGQKIIYTIPNYMKQYIKTEFLTERN